MMKKKQLTLAALLLLTTSLQAQQWPAVQAEARPGTRWWWLGSAVDKPNLSYLLEEYARAGMGAVEITPIYGVQGNDANDIAYLSPQWMEMLRHTEAEGRRTGIEVDMNTGTGWPFGGPEVSLEDAATKAIFESVASAEWKTVETTVRPDPKKNPYARLSRVMAYGPGGRCLDLTALVGDDGTLRYELPVKGEWRLITLYVGKTRQTVKRAAPGGEGYVMDHFSPRAVKNYLDRFDRAFQGTGTPYPHTFFNDSYEVYQADWTGDLLEEFARRRGYKLEDHFDEFLDEANDSLATTRRVVADYRETLSDLLLENFTRQWTDWAHRHGSVTRNQAHGSPANLIDVYAAVDIPECEGFGLSQFHIEGLRQDSLTRKNDSDLSMLKYASSAAHIAGKPFTSSETFTWLTEHFRTSLSQCKPDMDLMFVSGVNHAFFHGTPYSPREAEWPGWRFYASVNMAPTNSIWRDAPYMFRYITRCQSFLQMGKPDNDFLIYLPVYDVWHKQPGRLTLFSIHQMPDLAPKFIDAVHRMIGSGYDGDYISDAFVRSTRFERGRLVTAGGTAYKALVVPDARLMPVDVLEHLIDLARQGATIVFLEHFPEDVPGYADLKRRREKFRRVLGQVPDASSKPFTQTTVTPIGQGRIVTGTDHDNAGVGYAGTFARCGVKPEEMRTRHGLHAIRRSNATGYHYFIASLQPKDVDGWVTLAVTAQAAALFNPMDGKCGEARLRQTADGQTQVYLQLRSGESVILQTYNHPLQAATPWAYSERQGEALCLDRGWTLRFVESVPKITDTFRIDSLSPWTKLDHPDTRRNMGTALYSVEFELPRTANVDDWILDLGDVRESARVRVNGHDAGCVWAVPFSLHVGQWLKAGTTNKIEVEVTNLPANRIAELDREGVKWRKFKEINMVGLDYRPSDYKQWKPLPAGLNGKVRLIPVNIKKGVIFSGRSER
ncbi:MAG: glycosyl hydrolase family 2 [Mediterranea sp.]|nr:glycosyl hydrolase family 2 [Mediterranea sp.]